MLFVNSVIYNLVGYNYAASFDDKKLALSLGYSHTVFIDIPYGVFVRISNKRNLIIFSSNILKLTQFTSLFSKIKRPNIFTGKGIIQEGRKLILKKRSGA